jgi:biotin carboxylase
MSRERRVLVVGTTGDYVDWIDRHYPGRAIFLTDPQARAKASEPVPDVRTEVLSDLTDEGTVWAVLQEHLEQYGMEASGVVCFDDESMHLAALLAGRLKLPYPSPQAVLTCRSKHRCKEAWRAAGVPTARSILATSEADAADFARQLNAPCVLKPLTGSGSELVFTCRTPRQAADAFRKIRQGLQLRAANRMYSPDEQAPPQAVLAEELITSQEYSCDFLLEGGRARVIRFAHKLLAPNAPPGTARGYIIPSPPPGPDPQSIASFLARAAHAVGLDRAVCMLDFFADGERLSLLEIAPRPGGDCLPWLIRHSSGLDMLALALDFAERRPLNIPPADQWKPTVGLRIRADREGTLRRVRTDRLAADPRVRQIHLIRRPGHKIVLPPEDYDSWIFGHLVFQPDEGISIGSQCDDLRAKLTIEIEP